MAINQPQQDQYPLSIEPFMPNHRHVVSSTFIDQLDHEQYALFPNVVKPSLLALRTTLTEFKDYQKVIMLDRYSLKDDKLQTLKVGDLVVVEVKYHPEYPTQGYGFVTALAGPQVEVDVQYPESLTADDGSDIDLQHFVTTRNKLSKPLEIYWEQICHRVAKGVSGVEKTRASRRYWYLKMFWMLKNKLAIPGGRILYGAGTDIDVTLFNCFVLNYINDSRRGISRHRETAMEIMSRSGGVGTNGSTLRPVGAYVAGVHGKSSGAVSWLNDLSRLTELVQQGGSRRGAQMIGFADWHPDLVTFILCKIQNPFILDKITKDIDDPHISHVAESLLIRDVQGNPVGVHDTSFMTGANISVLISHDFMQAVQSDGLWSLRFPDLENLTPEQKAHYDAEWHNLGDVRKWEAQSLPTKVYHTFKASQLWDLINIAARYSAEPGIIFIDQCNDMSNAWYYAPLVVTNPCFAGNMRLLTTEGYRTFESLDGQQVTFINLLGRVSQGRVWKTGDKPTVLVSLDNGTQIECTEDHRFMLVDGSECMAKDLQHKYVMQYPTKDCRYGMMTDAGPRVLSVTPTGIVKPVYDFSEPETHWGVVEGIIVHNCGEQPLPADGVCNLLAINLAQFANRKSRTIDYPLLKKVLRISQRFSDNIIDHSYYFLPENERMAKGERRIGKGVMGLADLMIDLELPYGSEEMLQETDRLFEFIKVESYLASADIAAEKGSFPFYQQDPFLQSGFMQSMPAHVISEIETKGIRNVCSLTVAPTGTTGTMLGVSTGLEPYYAFSYFRSGRLGKWVEVSTDIARRYFDEHPEATQLPDYYVSSMDIPPLQHVKVQAVIQKHVDSSISKTCNAPRDFTVEQNKQLYFTAWQSGCKGVTVYVDGSRDKQVLSTQAEDNIFESDNEENTSVSSTASLVDVELSELTDDFLTDDTRTCSITFDPLGNMIKECH